MLTSYLEGMKEFSPFADLRSRIKSQYVHVVVQGKIHFLVMLKRGALH